MDGHRFDAVTRGVAREMSRRRVFGGLLGGAVALFSGTTVLAARRRRKKGRGSGQDADEIEGESTLLPGVHVGGVWDETIQICHFDWETGGHELKMVSAPALPDYLARGDIVYIDCCVDGDCRRNHVCRTSDGCVQGACMYTVNEGAACLTDTGAEGYCDADAICIPLVTAPVETAPVVTVPVETAPVVTAPVETAPVVTGEEYVAG